MSILKIAVLIIVIILVIIFEVYRYYTRDYILVSGVKEACCELKYSANDLPLTHINGGIEFTFSLWIYIASYEYKYDHEKIILYWKGRSLLDDILINSNNKLIAKCFELDTKKKNNKKKIKSLVGKYGGLKIALEEKTNTLVVSYSLMNGKTESIKVDNLPLQKWLNIVVLLRLRNFDVFVNGKLYANKFLSTVPLYGRHRLIINGKGGYDGFISNVKYYNRAITYPEIKQIYLQGNK